MAVVESAPYPKAPIAERGKDPNTGQDVWTVTRPWGFFFRDVRNDINQTPRQATPTPVLLDNQNAPIGTTTIVTPDSDGLYSVEYYAAITTAATTGAATSSLTVTLAWTDEGTAKSKAFTAITGNTTLTTGSERYLFRADGGAPITYATTYASNGAGEMHYDLDIVVSSVAAV